MYSQFWQISVGESNKQQLINLVWHLVKKKTVELKLYHVLSCVCISLSRTIEKQANLNCEESFFIFLRFNPKKKEWATDPKINHAFLFTKYKNSRWLENKPFFFYSQSKRISCFYNNGMKTKNHVECKQCGPSLSLLI